MIDLNAPEHGACVKQCMSSVQTGVTFQLLRIALLPMWVSRVCHDTNIHITDLATSSWASQACNSPLAAPEAVTLLRPAAQSTAMTARAEICAHVPGYENQALRLLHGRTMADRDLRYPESLH